ncbi:MAG TPA: hypothetical protein VOA88_02140 [Candidatus Dormibacteraeota bacterium]|nr:hypothetical protein [Candidatus Dormibacteraeota bacterium]
MSLLGHSLANRIRATAACAIGIVFLAAPLAASAASREIAQAAAQTPVAKQVGVVKSISGNALTLTTDSGTDVTVQVVSNAKMVRVAPGQTDLKSAAPIQLPDIHTGDRILVRGQPSTDGKSFVAVGVIAMSRSDVEAKHQSDREDWQKRGIGGLVSSVDPATGTITISVTAAGGKKTIAIHTTSASILRRYAPDSVSFDEAKPAPIDLIKPGDQLRARGTRSADGSEFAAEEVVSGSFRNIAGTISTIDANANTMTVMDLITKKSFAVKITSQSQLRRLPPEIAQRIAFRLKGAGATGDHAGNGAAGASGKAPMASGGSQHPEGGPGGNRPGGGQADFQQIVNRMPAATLADFKKDEAVMIVATEGTTTGQATAIMVLGGVEPILAATPTGGQAMTLSPWSLGGAPAVAGDSP